MTKKFKIVFILILVLVIFLSSCNKYVENAINGFDRVKEITLSEKREINVFAAASMTETLTTIKEIYEKNHPEVELIYTFDSSGTLLKQILAGADCDVFISAAEKQMNQLDITKDEKVNPDRNDYILEGTRVNLLENKVVLAVPDGNIKNIESFDDLKTDKLSLLAIGNSDVPVGAYTLEILEYLGKPAKEFEKEGKLTYGSNVKEVTTQVKQGAVDAGIIYATDAFSANLKVVDTATEEMCRQVIYPAAVLKTTKDEEVAKDYLEFLQSDEAMVVFKSVGFTNYV